MYALVWVIWLQWSNSLQPYVIRYEITTKTPFTDIASCEKAGAKLIGPLPETDPVVKFVWRDYKCVDMTQQ